MFTMDRAVQALHDFVAQGGEAGVSKEQAYAHLQSLDLLPEDFRARGTLIKKAGVVVMGTGEETHYVLREIVKRKRHERTSKKGGVPTVTERYEWPEGADVRINRPGLTLNLQNVIRLVVTRRVEK
ncbi:MAG: hypothetical protein ACOY0S_01600 [Patescibacteria group bacterium]